MLKIGLTGGIGSGKSTVASFFSKIGIAVIDLDQISRELVQPGTPALEHIQKHFSEGVLTNTGELDRAKLAEIVFEQPEEKQWLENLLHPFIREKQDELIRQAESAYVVIEIPLLTENNLAGTVDRVLVIDSAEELQSLRALKRGQQSQEQIEKIIASQASRMERQAIADDIILNDGTEEDLEREALSLHQKYLQLNSK